MRYQVCAIYIEQYGHWVLCSLLELKVGKFS